MSQLYIWGNNITLPNKLYYQSINQINTNQKKNQKVKYQQQQQSKSQDQYNKNQKIFDLSQNIQQISCGKQHMLILTKSKNIYVGGDNSKGQLGLIKHSYDNIQFRKLELSTIFFLNQSQCSIKMLKRKQQYQVKEISCGYNHTLLLTINGDVFSTGQGKYGALGYGDGQNSYQFKQISLNKVIKISAGYDHSLALTKTKVYGWGSSKEGQLGTHQRKLYYNPKELNVYPSLDIFAGIKYSFFSTSKGIFATGMNNQGQLGLGHQNSINTPKRLNIDQKIIKISGNHYIIALTQNKQGMLWGNGCFGKFLYPTKLQFITDVKDIAINSSFGLVKSQNGNIFVWGNNSKGQLLLNINNEYNQCQSIQNQDYVIENKYLSELKLDNISCGQTFAIGFKNLSKNKQFEIQIQQQQQQQQQQLRDKNYNIHKNKNLKFNINSQSLSSSNYDRKNPLYFQNKSTNKNNSNNAYHSRNISQDSLQNNNTYNNNKRNSYNVNNKYQTASSQFYSPNIMNLNSNDINSNNIKNNYQLQLYQLRKKNSEPLIKNQQQLKNYLNKNIQRNCHMKNQKNGILRQHSNYHIHQKRNSSIQNIRKDGNCNQRQNVYLNHNRQPTFSRSYNQSMIINQKQTQNGNLYQNQNNDKNQNNAYTTLKTYQSNGDSPFQNNNISQYQYYNHQVFTLPSQLQKIVTQKSQFTQSKIQNNSYNNINNKGLYSNKRPQESLQSLENLTVNNQNQSKHSLKLHDTKKKILYNNNNSINSNTFSSENLGFNNISNFQMNQQNKTKENYQKDNLINSHIHNNNKVEHEIQSLKIENNRLRKQNQTLRKTKDKKKPEKKEIIFMQSTQIQKISNQNQVLKRQSQKKSAYISKIRQEYLLLLDLVENNNFLKNVLHQKNPNFPNNLMQLYKKGSIFDNNNNIQNNQFNRQIAYLKQILQSAYKN